MFDDKNEKINLVRIMILMEVGLSSVFKHTHPEQDLIHLILGMHGRYATILTYHFDTLRLSVINDLRKFQERASFPRQQIT